MHVVVTDRRYPEDQVYADIVEEADGRLTVLSEPTEDALLAVCGEADVIVTRMVPVSAEIIEAAESLDLVMRLATGYDNIDVRAATAHGIPVSNVPGYAPKDIATHALGLAIAARHDMVYADRELRAGDGWGDRRLIDPLHDGTMGIVGLGRIGRELVPMARGLDMEVIAHDPYLADDLFCLTDVEPVEFDELLHRSDAISIHAPITELTHYLFDREAFEAMKPPAVLVNAARGPIVDEAALVEALDAGQLHAAALDVFEREPPDESPVVGHDRVICSQHRAGHTENAKRNVIETVRAELRRVLRGEPLRHVVNREVFQYLGPAITDPGM